MDNRDFGNIWQHGFTFPQSSEYHHRPEDASPVLRDPMRDVTTSSFLFSDYDPAFLTNFGQSFTHNFTGQSYVAQLPQIPESSGSFGALPVRQMIAATAPIPSASYPSAPKEFTVPLPPRLPSESSYSLISLDPPCSLPSTSVQPPSRIPPPNSGANLRRVPGEQPCQVCLAAASNGLHFGAKTCAACAAFFRRTVSDQKSYVCKRSQRCGVKLNDVTGYRKICRSCRMKRCLDVGMLPENVQNKRQRKEYTEIYSYRRTTVDDAGTNEQPTSIPDDGDHSKQPTYECIP